MAQWIERIVYLVVHEGLGGDLRRALASTWPALEMMSQHNPEPDAYLLYELPRRPPGPERDAIVYALQCQTKCVADLTVDEPTVVARAIEQIAAYPPFLSDLPRFISSELAVAARADAEANPIGGA